MKKHFPGFDSLRFFAAILVVIHHIASTGEGLGWGSVPSNFLKNGHTAVYFFFTLSGFLITYKLLQDKKRPQGVDIQRFYFRRMLRIWPLYFFVIAVVIIAVPYLFEWLGYDVTKVYSTKEIILYILFLPFVVNHFYGGDVLTPLWSIGVEEYFYLIWAPLLKYVKWERLFYFFIAIIILRLTFSVSIKLFDIGDKVIIALNVLRFEYMALGALGAYYFDKNPQLYQTFWFKKPAQLLLAVLLGVVLFNNVTIKAAIGFDGIYYFMTALLFLWLIINVGTNPYNILKLSNPLFEYLGKVSYGMYVFHTLVIAVVIKVFDKMFIKYEADRTFILYSSVILFTTLIAMLSYHFLEKPFLNYKKGAKTWSADPQIG